MSSPHRLEVFDTPEEVRSRGAELIVERVNSAISERGSAAVAVSGGRDPWPMFTQVEDLGIDWTKTEVFQVDERVAPAGDDQRNLTHLIESLSIGAQGSIRPMPVTDEDLEAAADGYARQLPEGGLDLAHLGMGPDGHTASLFPHTEALNEMAHIVVANHVPQKDTWRITLTWPVIDQGREVAFLIEGDKKAQVLHDVLLGPYQPETYPSQLIRPASGKLTLLLDAAAAAKLPAPANGGSTGVLELK